MPVDIVTFTGRDSIGRASRVNYYFDAGLSVADLQTWVTQHSPLLDDICGLRFESASVTVTLALPGGLKATPYAGALASAGANMAFDAQNTQYTHSIRIPAIHADLIGQGGGIIDNVNVGNNNTTVTGWASQIENGLTGPPPVVPSDRYSNDLVTFSGGLLTSRK